MTAEIARVPFLLVAAIAAASLTAANCHHAPAVASAPRPGAPAAAPADSPMLVPLVYYDPWGSSVELRPLYAPWFGVAADEVGAVLVGVMADASGAPLAGARLVLDHERTQIVYLEERSAGLGVRAASETGAAGLFAIHFTPAPPRDRWWWSTKIGATISVNDTTARLAFYPAENRAPGIAPAAHQAMIDRVVELWFRPYAEKSSTR